LVIAAIISIQLLEIFTIFDQTAQRNESYFFSAINFGIAIVCLVSTTICNYCFGTAGAKLTRRVRIRMFESAMKQEMGWFDLKENQPSLFSTRLATTSKLCQGLTTDSLNLITRSCSSIGTALVISLCLNPVLSIVLFVFAAIFFVSFVMFANKDSTASNGDRETDVNKAGHLMIQCSDNIKTVMGLGSEAFFIRQFGEIFQHSHKKALRSALFYSSVYAVRLAITFFTMAANFGLGSSLVKTGQLSVINLYRIYIAIMIMSDQLSKYFALFTDIKSAYSSAIVASKIIGRKPKIDSSNDLGIIPNDFKGDIEFKDVYFRYPTRTNRVLKGLSLKIEAYKMTALVGWLAVLYCIMHCIYYVESKFFVFQVRLWQIDCDPNSSTLLQYRTGSRNN
jgi:ATP-binding cassette subfamily B (MDR/TAP) protein 1